MKVKIKKSVLKQSIRKILRQSYTGEAKMAVDDALQRLMQQFPPEIVFDAVKQWVKKGPRMQDLPFPGMPSMPQAVSQKRGYPGPAPGRPTKYQKGSPMRGKKQPRMPMRGKDQDEEYPTFGVDYN